MNEQELKKLLKDQKYLQYKIDFYFSTKVITPQDITLGEIQGHIQKSDHNLLFVKDNSTKYSDWALVGCYYASYHAALALLLQKGVSSKNHDATLCLLIKYYYQKDLTQEDFELLNFVYLDNQDILFYIESKQEREKASYSSQIEFDKKKISELVMKTVLFVNKCKEILTQK